MYEAAGFRSCAGWPSEVRVRFSFTQRTRDYPLVLLCDPFTFWKEQYLLIGCCVADKSHCGFVIKSKRGEIDSILRDSSLAGF